MATVIVLYGPTAVGKSWVARTLVQRLGVHHLVLELMAAGIQPDPVTGWLGWVAQHLRDALHRHPLVSVEATGAWDSDWRLARDLEASGARVLRVWVIAPKQVALQRLTDRTAPRAPMSTQQASWIYDQATSQAAEQHFDAHIDTGHQQDPRQVLEALRPLLANH